MSNTLTNLIYHVVFSTKYRRPSLSEELRPQLYSYLGGILKHRDGIPLEIGGVADHVHLLAKLSAKHAIMDVVRDLKADSSKWINDQMFPKQRFEWQSGYGAFTVSASQVNAVRRYIRDQEEHHKKLTFKEEFLAFLQKHQIEFDLRYVFDEDQVA